MSSKAGPDRKESILVVEDDDSWLELCLGLLSGLGFETAGARNRMQALKKVDERAFDIVLTDLCLPDPEDGKAVITGVKDRHPKTDVIMMTASPTLETAIATLKYGAYDYIIKPFSADYLKTVIGRCFEKRRSQAELSLERRLREEVQAAYSELKKVEKLKEAFLSRVSHELNTPLAEALMAMNLLTTGLPEDGKSRSQAQVALEGVEKLRTVVADLLDFVDLQRAELELKREPVAIPPIFEEIAEAEGKLLEPKRLRLSIDFPDGLPEVPGDRDALKRAFRQLFLNAALFNKPEGLIEVSAKTWDQWLFIHVRDDGEGIASEKQDGIFDAFYQIADYMTRKVGGLGLGLAITKKIVEAHGGSISVTSAPDKGSDFKVCLPKGG